MSATVTRAARWAGLEPAAAARLAPLHEAGALEAVDLHVACTLAASVGETDPDVLLAVALAVRAPRFGHVCVDLRHLLAETLRPERDRAAAPLPLPDDREDWRVRVSASRLVRAAGPGATPFVLRGHLLYPDRWYAYEEQLRDALSARFARPREVADPALLRRGLAALFKARDGLDRQRLAAATAMVRGATVISGGPGTGKTWTVRNLLTLIWAQWAKDPVPDRRPRVALAAPTGKAAARVVASIRDGMAEHLEAARGALPPHAELEDLRSFLEESPPFTLHRLLGWRPDDPIRFRHHREHPLPYDLVVVDEASMVDLALMAKLVDAVPPEARLVLLGDRHQLASVEAGSVLADLCGPDPASGGRARSAAGAVRLSPQASAHLAATAHLTVPPTEPGPGPWDGVVFLTKSRRFDDQSGIGRFAGAAVRGAVATAVTEAAPWGAQEPGPLALGEDGRVVGRDLGRIDPHARGALRDVRALVVEGYRPYLERLKATPPTDPVALAALHRDALASFDQFRVLCAHREGPFGVQGMDELIARWLEEAGLIERSGPWWVGRPVLVTTNAYAVGRFNGDVGLVVRDAAGEPVVAFPGDDDGVDWLPPARLPEHQTVFAMTIHKSQGSEFRDVLVVLPDRPSSVLTRELVYTAVTRAKKRVTLLAAKDVLARGLERRVERASGLAGLLWETSG